MMMMMMMMIMMIIIIITYDDDNDKKSQMSTLDKIIFRREQQHAGLRNTVIIPDNANTIPNGSDENQNSLYGNTTQMPNLIGAYETHA